VRVQGACRPGGDPPGQDRWAATHHGVVVLDGATAFDPAAPTADRYVDALLAALADILDTPADLATIISEAIASVADRLQLAPGDGGPSSTVLLLREAGEWLDVTVLGDSVALTGFRDGRIERLTDNRMQKIAPDLRARYRERLRSGVGYDSTHRELLCRIQHEERTARNTEHGYWIAEADPAAAHHAIFRRYHRADVAWCVLATDGAQHGFDHHGIDWTVLRTDRTRQLHERLDELQCWEAEHDPNGRQLPRAKRHDDKTVVVWTEYGRPTS
jgi:hypothetical protein